MKVLVEIQDSKASFMMELLRALPFVRVVPLNDEPIVQMGREIQEVAKELILVKSGELRAIPAHELLNEM